MMHVEPTPCGTEMFGSLFFVYQGDPILLTASRVIRFTLDEQVSKTLDRLSRQVIAELISQASQCGLTQAQICQAMANMPEMPFERRQST